MTSGANASLRSPETSVIMPVHNAGAYLAPALESMLGQTYGDFELLLVDDHSDDGALGALEVQDARITRLSSDQRGVAHAFAKGLQAARGAFVARMDADDLALPGRLASQIGYLKQRPELGIAGGCVELFGAQAQQGGNLRYQSWLNALTEPKQIAEQIFIECPIPNPTAVFRREVLAALGGYRELDWPEDYDLFLRADRLGVAMGKPAGTLLRWREHRLRLTRTHPRYSKHNFQRAKVHHLVQGRLAGRELLLLGAGPTGAALHDLLIQAGARVLGFIDVHAPRVGGKKRGLPVASIHRLSDSNLPFLIGAAGSNGARAQMRRLLNGHQKIEGLDYLFMA